MADWHVGMQVIRIADWERVGGWGDEIGPVKGCIYTIREVLWDDFCGKVVLRLHEIRNPTRNYADRRWETAFIADCFRPVRKTSIDIFRSLLTPSGDDGAATPRSPVRVPLPSDLVQERGCYHADLLETRLPPGTTSRRATLAAGLARYADGRPLLSIHVMSSALSSLSGSKQTTGAFGGAKKQIYGK